MSTRQPRQAHRHSISAADSGEQSFGDEFDWSPIIAYLVSCATSWSQAAGPSPDERAQIAAMVTRAVRRVQVDTSAPLLPADTLAHVLTRAVDAVSRTRVTRATPAFDDRARLAAALLTGQSIAGWARACGITVANSYLVIALAIPRPTSRNGSAERNLMLIHDLLAVPAKADVLSQLSVTGGTVLMPATTAGTRAADTLRAEISDKTGLELTAAVVTAAPAQLPVASRDAHHLLDMAVALGRIGRLHCFGDLALEYQLCRPGPGHEQLLAIIEPLRAYPVLMETLRHYAGDGLNRRKLARVMGVHANTVDYRLDRVTRITGHNPRTPAGLSLLRAALLIDAIHSNENRNDFHACAGS
ncbi:PucR family transcriptional regulator [Nocardia niwae]|uniref:PucR family transcriptional regulator n=1 Tax=Nocardia niwae TaxID=626084 RepID=UPI0007A3EB13|nr:PucR family transcriptional regulator [Nocardia niwae]